MEEFHWIFRKEMHKRRYLTEDQSLKILPADKRICTVIKDKSDYAKYCEASDDFTAIYIKIYKTQKIHEHYLALEMEKN